MIIDAHVHVWPKGEPRPGWLPDARLTAPVGTDVSDLIIAMDRRGVDGAVVITPTFMAGDNGYILDAARSHPGRLFPIVHIDHNNPSAPSILRELAKSALGFRLHPQDWPDQRSMLSPTLTPLWQVATESGIVADLHIRVEQLPLVAELAAAFPDLSIWIDHMARPQIDLGPTTGAFRDLTALTPHKRVYLKLSALARFVQPDQHITALNEFVRYARDSLGAHRLMWGSDFPMTQQFRDYAIELDLIRDGCTFLTKDEQDLILGGTFVQAKGGVTSGPDA